MGFLIYVEQLYVVTFALVVTIILMNGVFQSNRILHEHLEFSVSFP